MLVNFSKKQERIMELILVLSVAVLPGLFNALFTHLGYIEMDYSANSRQAAFFLQILQQLLVLFVFFYVLYRQGKGFKHIGLSFVWSDIFRGLALLLTAYGFVFIVNIIISIFSFLSGDQLSKLPQNIDIFSSGSISTLLILFLIVNSFFEELIVRAYLITEVEELTNSSILAVILCVVIQTSYHIYQGIIPLITIATIFLVFSIYYVRSKRIMPLVLAHTYLNLVSVILSRYLVS